MWGFLIGLYLAMIIYPLFQEWRQRRHDRKSLERMRKHFASRRRWDVLKGQWSDDWTAPDGPWLTWPKSSSQITLCGIEPWHDLCRQSFAGIWASSIDTQRRQAIIFRLAALCFAPCARRADCDCDDREPVKLFHRPKTHEAIPLRWRSRFQGPAKTPGNEWLLSTPTDQTMGFDHVGLHHQPDLPPIVQEIPCRGAEADRTGSPVGLRSEIIPTPCLLMVAGRYPQETPAAHPMCGMTRRCCFLWGTTPARGTGAFRAEGRAKSPHGPANPIQVLWPGSAAR